MPKAEGDRVEINLDTQVLTVFKQLAADPHHHDLDRQRRALLRRHRRLPVRDHARPATSTSSTCTGAGTTASSARCGTRTTSTAGSRCTASSRCPSYPASHGCARIPMDIANYFPSLVTKGESVYVVGTADEGRQRLRRPGADHHDHDRAEDDDHAPKKPQAARRSRRTTPTTTTHPPTTTMPRDHDVAAPTTTHDDVSAAVSRLSRARRRCPRSRCSSSWSASSRPPEQGDPAVEHHVHPVGPELGRAPARSA